ncbi:hypothetical protein VB715_03120 [Crocosphaera sp. UHCC 0190]|uniref:hypothetical protein n=1 Tax=Crocosphaera sp. UHCC 0190 TaxID=3110246 RepID=UPI002B200D44|nr:hypothetical protein [Crocosphaera sp. UHCC 0190]MEA5508748.1 hypothetical protein [Crocosphaera sp. UHCC 0190]
MKQYKVLTLGASGGGKTVFLASLFKQLSTQGEHGFFLDVENHYERKLLNQYYTEIVTGDAWPKPTKGTVKEGTFTCSVKTPDLSIHPACKFVYKDYPGGLLSEIAEDEFSDYNINFNQEVKSADAVLAILDGQKVLQFLQGKHDKFLDIWLHTELANLMHLIQECPKIPVHFIISKWDLIDNHGSFDLSDIRHRLNKIEEFKNVVKYRNVADCPIRLIPVSSVGFDFATFQEGSMRKKSEVMPKPFQTEIPLACVLIDGLQVELKKAIKEQEELAKKNTEVLPDFCILGQVNNFISGIFLSLISPNLKKMLPNKYQFDNETFEQLIKVIDKQIVRLEKQAVMTKQEIEKIERKAKEESEKLRRKQEQALNKINSETTALGYVVKQFSTIASKLDKDFPSSNLGGTGI